ncbi:mitochondrial nicotinamide adenine dinucleotide transporter SLC25A51 [Brevipalpus obovatus]|uniref:mitochondrial nicotinamide adenine dinucleotide transporter SLC25A51 n=1 Tax=Brevipalpus obovatus TaxID=246614 RepID=UPI003D9ED160
MGNSNYDPKVIPGDSTSLVTSKPFECDDSREFICGYGAAFINICLTFPINKVMFRQMMYGVKTNSAFLQLRKEGIYHLYRGLLPPLMSKTLSVSLMFGTYHQYQKMLDTLFPHIAAYSAIRLTVAALLAGCTEAVLTPFERVQTLLQDPKYNHQFNNTFHTFKEIRRFGIKEYYRGLAPILLRNGPSNVLFFSLRDQVMDTFPPRNKWWSELVVNFASGACIGALISTVFYPVNVIKTKMQTNLVGSNFISMSKAAKLVYIERQGSIRAIFYGVHLNYARSFLSWGIINASYEMLRKFL